jgi:hypothetical protein
MNTDINYILSFDCADKTLGVCLIGYLPKPIIIDELEFIKTLTDENFIQEEFSSLINNMLFVEEMWLFNLLGDVKVRDTEDYIRLARLKYALKSINKYLSDNNITLSEIHIEYQMGQNDLTRLISPAIIYEFVNEDNMINLIIGPVTEYKESSQSPISISVIQAAAKNSFCFHESIAYNVFAAKYQTNTTANKKHTAENFRYFLEIQNKLMHKKIDASKISHKEINHIADAFMQSAHKIFQGWNL